MNKMCELYLRESKVFICTQYFTKNAFVGVGEPIIVCDPTVDALVRNIPTCLQESRQLGVEAGEAIYSRKPNPLLKLAKVRSWKAFERGTANCALVQTEQHYRVIWSFPAPFKRGFIGNKLAPDAFFPLNELDKVAEEVLTHLMKPENHYPT
jgi:hypothetical protein